jgi:O-antigen ligase
MMLWILIGYMFLFIHRPFEVWPALATIHLERIYMLMALLAAAVCPGKRWLPNGQHLAYLAFAAAVFICWMCSPWALQGQRTIEDYFKIVVFYVLIVTAVHDERGLKLLLLGFLVVMALYMAHSLREYLLGRHTYRQGIPRMMGVDSALGDPNSFGASIVYALPFVTPFWACSPSRRLRCFLVAYVAVSVTCIGLTGSRSAFVGLLLCIAFMMMRSRVRWRWVVPLLLIAPILWVGLPEVLQNRYATIIDPSAGPAVAQTSAQSRIDGLFIGMRLWDRSPITGCGPGAWRPATGRKLESHNLYGQLIGEMGTLGALAFAAIVVAFWLNLRWMRQVYRRHSSWGYDFLYHVGRAVGLAVLLLLVEGNFGHNLYRHNWLWYGGFLIIACHCVHGRLRNQPIGNRELPRVRRSTPVAPRGDGQASDTRPLIARRVAPC